MRFAKSLSTVFVAALVCAPSARSQTETFMADPAQSQVAFTLGDTLHTVHGTFHLQSGTVRFDPKAQQMSGNIIVAAASGSSGDGVRDRRMTHEYLEAPKFALATFSPKSFTGALAPSGDSTIQVQGTFTLHGTPHEITLPMQLHIDGNNCTAKTHFLIPYVKWGIKDPSAFLIRVNKEVLMDITLGGKISAPGTEAKGYADMRGIMCCQDPGGRAAQSLGRTKLKSTTCQAAAPSSRPAHPARTQSVQEPVPAS